MSVFLLGTLFLAQADPQELPEEESSSSEEQESDSSPESDSSTESSNEDEAREEGQELEENPEKFLFQRLGTTGNDDFPDQMQGFESEGQNAEPSPTELTESSETNTDSPSELNIPDWNPIPPVLSDDDSDDEDFDISFLKGSLQYSLNFHYWKTENEYEYLNSFSISGEPQYVWSGRENINPLLGLRFQWRGLEDRQSTITDNLIGVVTGLQIGPVRINTAGAYYNNFLFNQQEITRDTQAKEIVYSYQELPASKGFLWEQTLYFSRPESDFAVEGKVAFPFQIQGDRDMGEPFSDALSATANIHISSWLVGYRYSVFPNSTEHILSIGNSLHF